MLHQFNRESNHQHQYQLQESQLAYKASTITRLHNGWTGKMDQDEYTDLMKNISKNGIREPGILIISGNGANYEVQLGEGNHRLRVAEKLQIEMFPMTFSYRFG